MKLIDCFMYFDEDLVLEIRLNTLANVVDEFIIAEATKDHAGRNKKLNFDIFSSSFSDGNELNILELKSKERKISLEDHLYIKSFNFDNETNDYSYKLAFNSSKDLKNFKATINNDKTISIINFEVI